MPLIHCHFLLKAHAYKLPHGRQYQDYIELIPCLEVLNSLYLPIKKQNYFLDTLFLMTLLIDKVLALKYRSKLTSQV